MNLGINILFLEPGRVGGSETYSREILKKIDKQFATKNKVFLYCTKTFSDSVKYSNIKKIVGINNSVNKLLRLFYEIFVLPIVLNKNKIDVLLSMGYTSPIFTDCKKLVVIHDLQYKTVPYTVGYFTRVAYSLLMPLILQFNDKIIVPSNFSKNEITKYYKVNPKKIEVIYEGAGNRNPRPLSNERRGNYIMTAAASHPHKNLDVLVDAFSLIVKKQKYADLKLYVTGFPSLAHKDILKKIKKLKLKDKVIFLGWLERKKYLSYLCKSRAFVFISSYEGFGLPPLEAMAMGTPVIASDKGSLREILGGNTLLVKDPRNSRSVADKIELVLENRNLSNRLSKKGISRSMKFSWQTTFESLARSLSSFDPEAKKDE